MRRYYVYELIDPRTGKPFYVGKGVRNRFEHLIAKRGYKWLVAQAC